MTRQVAQRRPEFQRVAGSDGSLHGLGDQAMRGDAFRTLINADTALHGVTASGTTTLILTGAAGASFTYSASANMVAAVTTAAAPEAMQFPNARFLSSASANELAVVQLG